MKTLQCVPVYDRHWIIPKEALLAFNYLSSFPIEQRYFLEVGVLTGSWSLNLLRNFSKVVGFGVDPYPNLSSIKDQFLLDVLNYDYKLYPDLALLPDLCRRISMIHIDGLHTQEAVLHDLEYSLPMLSDDGILIIDDYLHPYFPGVAAALYDSIPKFKLAPFLNTGAKSYLCRSHHYLKYFHLTEKIFSAQSEIPWCHHWGEGVSNAYISTPSVHSYIPILSPERYIIKPSNEIIKSWPEQPRLDKPQEPC